jgi:hypothetical protein
MGFALLMGWQSRRRSRQRLYRSATIERRLRKWIELQDAMPSGAALADYLQQTQERAPRTRCTIGKLSTARHKEGDLYRQFLTCTTPSGRTSPFVRRQYRVVRVAAVHSRLWCEAYGAARSMFTDVSSQLFASRARPNPSVKGTSCGKPQAALTSNVRASSRETHATIVNFPAALASDHTSPHSTASAVFAAIGLI